MHTQIKICGVTNPETAYFAAKKGANWIGIVCAKRSSRYVAPEYIDEITQASIEGGAEPVLVFENEQPEIIMDLLQKNTVNYVQLHGNITQYSNCDFFTRIKTIIALPIISNNKITEPTIKTDFLLFDAANPGSGNCFSWQDLKQNFDFKNKPFFLAGGLNSNNVLSAIQCLKPFVVDVSTGVELKPGIKDKNKIANFIDTVRGNDQ